MSSGSPERTWDAGDYHRVAGPQEAMGRKVLERLQLQGDETVLDAGCGSGRVTAVLLDRLPQGRVIAIDADQSMVDAATKTLAPAGPRATVQLLNLLDLNWDDAVDAVLSTATFHWVLDHQRLFDNLFRAIRPGGQLVAQCGGKGNLAAALAAGDAVAAEGHWRDRFAGWSRPSLMASAEETAENLERSGFVDVNCWLAPEEAVPDDPALFLATVTCGAHLDVLDPADRPAFVDAVMARLNQPLTLDYVRLNIDARVP